MRLKNNASLTESDVSSAEGQLFITNSQIEQPILVSFVGIKCTRWWVQFLKRQRRLSGCGFMRCFL